MNPAKLAISPWEKEIINAVIKNAMENNETTKVFLFGSRAMGASHEDSDLDILVLVREFRPELLDFLKEGLDVDALVYLSLTVLTEAQFGKDKTFQREVLEKGIELWNRDLVRA